MAASDYERRGRGDFCPAAKLANGISYLTDSITVTDLVLVDTEQAGDIYVGMSILIDEEILVITSMSGLTFGVGRGCCDTIPAQHGAGARVWFFERDIGSDNREYASGDTIGVKVMPFLASGASYPHENVEPKALTFNFRFLRPYPPGQMQVRSAGWWLNPILSALDPTLPLTWAHRHRVVQADQLVDHLQGNVGPEPGTTYHVEVYTDADVLVRTETGITGTSWAYTWSQAMSDFGAVETPVESILEGYMLVGSLREGFLSWQRYLIPFRLDTQGEALMASSMAIMTAQEPTVDPGDEPGIDVLMAGSLAKMVAQEPVYGPGEEPAPAVALYSASTAESATQMSAVYTPLSRVLFEAPYTHVLRLTAAEPTHSTYVTAVARPADRLTDTYAVWARQQQLPDLAELPYTQNLTAQPMTPWLTIDETITPLQTTVRIRRTSLSEGVPLTGVTPGQLALLGAEVVSVVAVGPETVVLARGCCDTVPAGHRDGQRLWFFEAASAHDPSPWSELPVDWSARDKLPRINVKMVPATLGLPLSLNQVPTDLLKLDRRRERPFPPGQVRVNGNPWFRGAAAAPDISLQITWVHRNRITQGTTALDHTAPGVTPEPGTRYRLRVAVPTRTTEGWGLVVLREVLVEGTSWTYTYAMAYADGQRAARLLDSCGAVTVGMTLDAIRDEIDNWQGYIIPFNLPAPQCPIDRAPGGGRLPPSPPGRGNGDNGSTPGDPTDPEAPEEPPPGNGDDSADDDPFNGPGSGDNGSGPNNGIEMPPDWPYIVDPPPDPDDPVEPPEQNGNWDIRWDYFYATDSETP